MVQKDPEVRVVFQYTHPDEDDSTVKELVYHKPKNVDSIIKCLVEDISEELDKLRLEKKVSCKEKTCFIQFPSPEPESTIEKLIIDINDPVKLKQTVERILGTFDAADQEIRVFIDDSLSTYNRRRHAEYTVHNYKDKDNVIVFPPGNSSKKSVMLGDDASDSESLRTNSKISYDEDKKTVGTSTKNLYNEDDTQEHYVGLVNQAMTCYLNSLLQALYMTPEFRNALYNWEYKERDCKERDCEMSSIPFQLQKLFLNLQTSQKSSVETTSLTRSFGWDSSEAWQQHDIQELCRVMFDALEQKFKNTEQADLINKLYEGKINDYVKCLDCNTVKSREDTFLDIPLPVRPFDANEAYGSVEEALDAFVKYETLEGNNQYFCEKCDKKTNAHKGLKFTKFPYILTLQLKRFDFDQTSCHRIKLNDKVTFPDVLNLNSFIESASNLECPSPEEDAGLSVKCDESCTTDSSTVDEECVSSNAIASNSNHLTNHDQLDDEGIVMSNGMSPSSCSSLNQNHEKLREECESVKGPYVYELFSIMIHSGSASGGHYYAYIKDFRTGKWLCFNDQNVTSISSEDIQKTYGGGNKSSYYAGAYRSSTNAYMLMYRQIDQERNRLPMKAEDFPDHIKDLFEKMKNEDNTMHTHYQSFRMPVYYQYPSSGTIKAVNINVSMNDTFAKIAAEARKRTGLEDLVDQDQCRIVTYIDKYNLVGRAYDQNVNLDDLFGDESKIPPFLLEIRDKKMKFEPYKSDPIVTKVYVIDALEKDLIDGPKYIRAFQKMYIKEYKEELLKHFPTLDPTRMILLCKKLLPDKLLHDELIFEEDHSVYMMSVCDAYTDDTIDNVTESVFFKMSEYLEDIVTFYIDTSDITLENMDNIPSYSDCYKEEKPQGGNFIINHYYNCSVDKEVKQNTHTSDTLLRDMNEMKLVKKILALNESKVQAIDSIFKYKNTDYSSKEEWNIQETSNSEDSSLSDSDRTLVGDVPEESTLLPNMMDDLTRNYYPEDYEKDKGENEVGEKYFKCIPVKGSTSLKIIMDQSTTREELKEKLEKHIDVPKNYFRISPSPMNEPNSYMTPSKFKEDQTYSISLGRVTYADETEVKVYILKMESPEPVQKLYTIVMKKDWRISELLTKIEPKIRKEISENFPAQWLILEYNDEVGDVIENFDNYSVCEAICIVDKVTFLSENESYVREWDRSEFCLGDPQRISISNKCTNELKEKISEISKIPLEFLELSITTAAKEMKCKKIENLEWTQTIDLDTVSFKTYILYRNSRESPKNLLEKGVRRMPTSIGRQYCNSNQWRPRREKPLVIRFDTST